MARSVAYALGHRETGKLRAHRVRLEMPVHSWTRLTPILSVILLIGGFTTVSRTQVLTAARRDDSILHFPVSRQELGDRDRGRVLARVKDYLTREPRYRGSQGLDLVVIFTDESGRAILPESAAETAAPEAAEPTGGNVLSFTFNSPQYPWTAQQVAFLSAALNDFYRTATRIYGPPAFNITVNVRRDPTISFSGLYFPSTNEMVVRSATVGTLDVLCHEMLHAFRDDNVISLNTFEEGMARAGEIEIFDRLAAYVHPFDEAHAYEYDVYYELLNRPEIGSPRGSFYDGHVATLLRYQLAGYAWGKALIENSQFLARFNRAYYRKLKRDSTTRSTEAALLNIAANAQHHVEGEPFAVWYSHQHVLNTAPPTGFALYQLPGFTIYFFERDAGGFVRMMSNTVLEWRVSDRNGALLDAGSGTTTRNGWVLFTPAIPAGYSGRLDTVGSALTPSGQLIENTTSRDFISSGASGVFGVVGSDNDGTVEIRSLDHPKFGATVSVVNGAFSASSLETARGRFVGRFFVGGELKQVHFFTKDASRYFLQFR